MLGCGHVVPFFFLFFFFKCCAVVKLVGEGAHAYGMACPCEFYVLLCVLLVCVLFWLRALLLCLMCCPLLSCVYGLPGSQCLPAFVLLCVLCCAFFFFCPVLFCSFVLLLVSPSVCLQLCLVLYLYLLLLVVFCWVCCCFRAAFLRLLCLCACCLLVDVCVCCCAYCLCVRLWFVLCVCFAFPALGVWQMWARTRPLGELLGCTSLYLKKKKKEVCRVVEHSLWCGVDQLFSQWV